MSEILLTEWMSRSAAYSEVDNSASWATGPLRGLVSAILKDDRSMDDLCNLVVRELAIEKDSRVRLLLSPRAILISFDIDGDDTLLEGLAPCFVVDPADHLWNRNTAIRCVKLSSVEKGDAHD